MKIADCDNSAVEKNPQVEKNRRAGSWLGRLPSAKKVEVIRMIASYVHDIHAKICRYKWLIRPLIHRNAIASLDWIGKSAPVPLLFFEMMQTNPKIKPKKAERGFTSVQIVHTHALLAQGFFDT